MSLSQALKLARVELAGLSGRHKAQRLGQIVRLFASEVAGTVALAPFALKASQLYAALRPPTPEQQAAATAEQDVRLIKGIHYGAKPRNTLDVYLPADAAAGAGPLPVVLFVHGGVWAAGESWHYAPLGASLARLGVMACVMQYTLYPDALVPQLVQEVSAAFDWALENAATYGGDAQQVSLVGHSAGAQLCMMALLQRAQGAHEAAQAAAGAAQGGTSSPHDQLQQQQQQVQQPAHLQMPHTFVGVTGVYDVAKHFDYEKRRGVHSLSTMLPAMGGFQHFAANSPSVILAAALQGQQPQQEWQQQQQQQQQQHQQRQQQPNGVSEEQQQQQQQQQQEPPACSFYSSFPLSGESISHRIGFDRGSPHHLAAEAGLTLQSLSGMTGVPPFPLEAAAHLPPVVLLSSCTDMTVPWYESAELYWRLYDCGVPVKHLVYDKVGHGEFVTAWPASFAGTGTGGAGAAAAARHAAGPTSSADGALQPGGPPPSLKQLRAAREGWLQQLPPYCRDLAVVVQGQQPINYVQQGRGADGGSGRKGGVEGSSSVPPARGLAAATADVDAEVLLQGAADLN